ncbi:MAG: B12-binding domain-containing protein, partial [Ignavibacteriales bacterium]|nr:B12-binding domain-containing protein [Ignavibacteriales bacterium]
NLEDGEERINKVVPLCKKYGAAIIALTIDEQGMAKTAEHKLAIAKRIYDLVVNKYKMKPHDLIFDTLTFTLGSGDEEFRRAGIETIEAIRLIKKEFPEVKTLLGVSNISFGLSPHSRHAINSVFLHYAVEVGLDLAIVHAAKIMPLFKLDEKARDLCRQLIFDERKFETIDGTVKCVYDPLTELMAHFASHKGEKKEAKVKTGTVEERLKNRIIDGDKVGLQKDLDEALTRYAALEIVNTILLDGMKVVGDLFGSGQMQLPFVLQSAEVMKSAVAYLEQFMDKADSTSKGTMVIATVKGDVHDIGKNLVDIILTNNGYKVINLGIKCSIETMLHGVDEHKADAIGMSGLLVKSTLIMKENLEVMNERNITIPVVLGGAALTRRYVEQDLKPIYKGKLSYANDAFAGLRFMEELASAKSSGIPLERIDSVSETQVDEEDALTGLEAKIALSLKADEVKVTSSIKPAEQIPIPPFWGSKVVEDIPLDEVFQYINEVALFRGQWQVRKGKMTHVEYEQLLKEKIYPEYESLKSKVKSKKLLQPKVVYGYFPCNSNGNDLIVYTNDEIIRNPQSEIRNLRFSFPRQSKDRHLCISDFFARKDSGKIDVVAFHLVTMGTVASEYAQELFKSNNYKDYLYFHGLSVEATEALAEMWHKKIREELGIHRKDAPEIRKLFSQQYQGSRYSFGYPACPNLEDHVKLFELLMPERIGVELTEEFQLVPEQSTDAIIVHHPEARYFNV